MNRQIELEIIPGTGVVIGCNFSMFVAAPATAGAPTARPQSAGAPTVAALATTIEKKTCLQNSICHKSASSKDFTITPPKLRQRAPSKTRIAPGILFNIVNLSL